MSYSLNRAEVIGRLGQDPDMRTMPSGQSVCNLSIATSETWKDKNTGEKKEHTEWHRVAFFGALADIAGRYLTKGSQVYVAGQLRTRKWQDQSGQDRYSTEIRGDDLVMLDGKQTGQAGGQQRQEKAQGSAPPDFDDSIPF